MKIFIGHRHDDVNIARRLTDLLTVVGHEVWFDDQNLPSGRAGLSDTLTKYIYQSEVAAFIITPRYAEGSFLAQELSIAIGRRKIDPDFHVIPLMLRMTNEELRTPASLSDYSSRFLRDEMEAATELLRAIKEIVRDRALAAEGIKGMSRTRRKIFRLEVPNGSTMTLGCIKEPYGGRLLVEELPTTVHGSALDLGTGCGVIGLAAARLGADTTMIDISVSECELARDNAAANELDCRIIHGDYFVDNNIPDKEYDLILTNPPQLPSRENFDIRECGGTTGWDHIDRMLQITSERLTPDGVAFLYVLDLLGIYYPTGSEIPFQERADKLSLQFTRRRVCQRRLGPGSPVYRELLHIAEIYPDAEFLQDAEGLSVIPAMRAVDAALEGEELFLAASIIELQRRARHG